MATFDLLQRYLLILTFYQIYEILHVTASNNDYALKSVNMVFRHGDRTPDGFASPYYLTDPYRNYDYQPTGLGALTNTGKLRMYDFGRSLRVRYNDFLGSTYRSEDVSVKTTPIDRTKASALLVLAGLYPPNRYQQFSKLLPSWQPITFDHGLIGVDPMISFLNCPMYLAELNRVQTTMKFKRDESKFHDLLRKMSYHLGRTINDTWPLAALYQHLSSQDSLNLPLPEWTKAYYPDGPLNDAAVFHFELLSYNRELTQLSGGVAVKKLLNSMLAIVEGKEKKSPKINLISAHDLNVAGALHALNLWNKAVPPYSSAVIFELYERHSLHFVRVVHFKGIPAEYEVMTLPGCSEYCLLEHFIYLTRDFIPGDSIEACFGPTNNSLLIPKDVDPVSWIYEHLRKWT